MALCSNLEEVRQACARNAGFDLFITEELIPGIDELNRLSAMSKDGCFKRLLIVGNYSSCEKSQLFKWALEKRVGLLDVVEKPMSAMLLLQALEKLPKVADCNLDADESLVYELCRRDVSEV